MTYRYHETFDQFVQARETCFAKTTPKRPKRTAPPAPLGRLLSDNLQILPPL